MQPTISGVEHHQYQGKSDKISKGTMFLLGMSRLCPDETFRRAGQGEPMVVPFPPHAAEKEVDKQKN